MSAEIAGGWIAWSVAAVGMGIGAALFVRYFEDRHDRELLPTVITITSLALVLGALCLVPVDVFLIASTTDPATGERESWADQDTIDRLKLTLEILYYVVYATMTLFAFVVIPFAYFYFEEAEEDITVGKRCMEALKYTSFTIAIFLVVLLLGLFLKPTGEGDEGWYNDLLASDNIVRAVSFMAGVLAMLGLLIFITYTAYGLSAMPVGWIRGHKNVQTERLNVVGDLEANQEKQRALKAKYMSGKKMSNNDKKQLDQLEREEKLLNKRTNVLEHQARSWSSRCYNCIRPFLMVFGIIFLLFVALILTSLMLTGIDKAMHSSCGSRCGWVVENPKIFNPLDEFFIYVSYAFPLDFIFFVGMILMFFCSTLSGIIRIGIRILWVKLYAIRPKATVPQGLLITTMLLMMALLYLNVFIFSVAPTYSTFGYQKYCTLNSTEDNATPCSNNTDAIHFCDMDAPASKCTTTSISDLVNRISVLTPFFGVVYYAGSWIFFGMFIIGFLFSVFRRKPSEVELHSDSEDDE